MCRVCNRCNQRAKGFVYDSGGRSNSTLSEDDIFNFLGPAVKGRNAAAEDLMASKATGPVRVLWCTRQARPALRTPTPEHRTNG